MSARSLCQSLLCGLRSVECVVNDEDPDAMLSFLKYYVAQMHSRQELFERMEEATGVIIQQTILFLLQIGDI